MWEQQAELGKEKPHRRVEASGTADSTVQLQPVDQAAVRLDSSDAEEQPARE